MTMDAILTRNAAGPPPGGAPAAAGRPVSDLMAEVGRRARSAARRLALATAPEKDAALRLMADRIRARGPDILAANADDVAEARAKAQTAAFLDRLTLDAKRLDAVAEAVASIAGLPDPVGRVLATFERPNGLRIERSVFERDFDQKLRGLR